MNRRLEQFLAAENITQAQLADTLQVARASVSHILAGRNRPGFDFIESMALHYPELNLDWLVTGRGKMYNNESISLTESVQQTAIQKKITKITVFYDDNTFQDYTQ